MSSFWRKSLALAMTVLMFISSAGFSMSAYAIGKVSSLKVTSTTRSSATIKWKKVKGAKNYRVYRYDPAAEKWTYLKSTTSLSFTEKELDAGKRYIYGVKSVAKEKGKTVTSKMSSKAYTVTKPATVTGLKATKVGSSDLTLTWNKLSGVRGYAVYRYNASSKKYTLIERTLSNTYKVSKLKADTSYTFAVRAYVKYDSLTYGAYSSKLTVKTALPSVGAVKNLKLASVGEGAFRLQWDKVSQADGYQVCEYDASSGKQTATTYTTKNYITISKSDSTKKYVYAVRAYAKVSGKNVYGAYSGKVTAFTKPATPSGLEGSQSGKTGISLKWNSVGGASGYEVYSYDAVNGKWIYEGTTTKTSYTDKGIKSTSHYKYRVRAYRLAGEKKHYGEFCESVNVEFVADESDSIYSEAMEKSGVFGYLFDPKELYFYTADDPWQRNVGYNSIFDTTSNIALIDFDTVRLRFEYGGKDWMIQLWKGQYGLLFYGAEVGVYTKPKDREVMHYDCASDDEMLKMSMDFLEKKNGKWNRRFTRPYGYYWWCTGFIPGNKLGDYSGLGLDMRITAKDNEMLAGIKSALEKNKIEYRQDGLDLYFSYR